VPSIVALSTRVEDVVADGVTGVIVPPRDPAALAAAIVRLADDPALRTSLGVKARAQAATRSDPTAVARRIVAIYREVAARATNERVRRSDRPDPVRR
jgi:starch synthase